MVKASIAKLRRYVKETPFTADRLSEYCRELSRVCEREIEAVVDVFSDKEVFPDRPQIILSDRRRKDRPTVWLLCWRQGEGTPIHDHVDSRAAISVWQGQITERVWSGVAHMGYARTLHAPSLVEIPTPYIHLFENVDNGTAVSLHVYWPPLTSMRYFREGEGGLVYTGTWEEGEGE